MLGNWVYKYIRKELFGYYLKAFAVNDEIRNKDKKKKVRDEFSQRKISSEIYGKNAIFMQYLSYLGLYIISATDTKCT